MGGWTRPLQISSTELEYMLQTIEVWGLGIRRIRLHNKVLLAKWLQRFGIEKDSLWRKVVVVRCGEGSHWESRKSRRRHGCGLWKSIMAVKEDFWKFISFSIGSGETISFCSFIYHLVLEPKAPIANCYDSNRSCWDPKLRREPNDQEVGEMIRLLETLGNCNPSLGRQDRWVQRHNQKGVFTSKSFYLELSNTPLLTIPHKGIWNPDIPSTVAFFIRNSFLDKILTLNHLQSRCWNLTNRCILCIEESELVNHIFIHCSMAKRAWNFFLSHLHIPQVFPRMFNKLIMGWWVCDLENFPMSIWHALPGGHLLESEERKKQQDL